ncbi:MAG: ATP-dependent Lon protease [Vibrionaceae bacterium]
MTISPANVGIAVLAPGVNPQTEQAARVNRARNKVTPVNKSQQTTPDNAIFADEKQMKRPSWDPADHPRYSYGNEESAPHPAQGLAVDSSIEEMAKLISIDTYVPDHPNHGYSLKLKLPKVVLEQLAALPRAERQAAVVALRYKRSSVGYNPSDVSITI